MAATTDREKNILLAADDEEDFFIFSLALEEIDIKVALSRVEDGEALLKMI